MDAFAFNVLHRKIGESIVGRAAVEQARDVRVDEGREDLPLVLKSPQDSVGIHAAFDEFERYSHFELLVGAPRQINFAHPARANALEQLVSAYDPIAAWRNFSVAEDFGGEVRRRLGYETIRRLARLEESLDFLAHFLIAPAGFIQESLALAGRKLPHIMENFLEPLQWHRAHLVRP
jgi:hypothetical protein